MLARLRAHARAVAARSHVPYSRAPAGAAVLFADGTWTAAPRIENASFPLSIPAIQGTLALAALLHKPAVALALSRPVGASDLADAEHVLGGSWDSPAPEIAMLTGQAPPIVGDPAPLTLTLPPPPSVADGAALAVAAAGDAVVPASHFPVGAIVEDASGHLAAGANVEVVQDWTRGLCAERTALVKARASGLGPIRRIYVACVKVPGGTPCGACRQVLAELAPDAEVVIWQGTDRPEITTTSALLPGAFGGNALTG
ncbi:MAG: cytidine deaminase [Bacteroidota bacterium]